MRLLRLQYYADQLYDIRYPGMDPIMCVIQKSNNKLLLCFVEVETSFFLPFFNHIGSSFDAPEICNW
jgi:hypothetical protein